MNGSTRTALAAMVTAGLVSLGGSTAVAAPPPNDARADAITIKPPDSVNGTVVDATLQTAELPSLCRDTDASVWYRFTPPRRGSVIVALDAAGELDATIDVYRRRRSRLIPLDCDDTNRKGKATVDLDGLDPRGDYLIRVGKLTSSDPAAFKLSVLVPRPPAQPPGKLLPRKGVRDSVDRLLNPSDAYSVRMRRGEPYRLSLDSDRCVGLALYPPGTRSFGRSPKAVLSCGGYRLFTPRRSGRWVLRVEARRRRDVEPYRLQVGRARRDDTVPGIFIRNYAHPRGRVNGHLDSVDLYRFDVVRRSTLTLRVSGGPKLALVKPSGRRISTRSSTIRREVGAGRYYVAVRGRGSYRLRRITRATTHSTVAFNGRGRSRTSPGVTSRISLGVRPSVSGHGKITVERFDPLDGWQFLRTYRVRVSGGSASVAFTPPSVGRYRASAKFRQSRTASASETRFAKLRVRGPLVE